MNVGELIEELKQYDKDMPVYSYDDFACYNDGYLDILRVETVKDGVNISH